MNKTNTTARGLPRRCHVVMPGFPEGANVGIATPGRMGIEMTFLNLGPDSMARTVVRAINEVEGIDPATEFAMLIGSMYGWNEARADPAFLRRHDHRFNIDGVADESWLESGST